MSSPGYVGCMRSTDLDRIRWVRSLVEQSGAARAVRESAGLSLEEVAAAVGVTGSAVGRWERGERIPRGPRALIYARLLERLHRSAA